MDLRRRGTRGDGPLISGLTGYRPFRLILRNETAVWGRALSVGASAIFAFRPAILMRFALIAYSYTNSSLGRPGIWISCAIAKRLDSMSIKVPAPSSPLM